MFVVCLVETDLNTRDHDNKDPLNMWWLVETRVQCHRIW